MSSVKQVSSKKQSDQLCQQTVNVAESTSLDENQVSLELTNDLNILPDVDFKNKTIEQKRDTYTKLVTQINCYISKIKSLDSTRRNYLRDMQHDDDDTKYLASELDNDDDDDDNDDDDEVEEAKVTPVKTPVKSTRKSKVEESNNEILAAPVKAAKGGRKSVKTTVVEGSTVVLEPEQPVVALEPVVIKEVVPKKAPRKAKVVESQESQQVVDEVKVVQVVEETVAPKAAKGGRKSKVAEPVMEVVKETVIPVTIEPVKEEAAKTTDKKGRKPKVAETVESVVEVVTASVPDKVESSTTEKKSAPKKSATKKSA